MPESAQPQSLAYLVVAVRARVWKAAVREALANLGIEPETTHAGVAYYPAGTSERLDEYFAQNPPMPKCSCPQHLHRRIKS